MRHLRTVTLVLVPLLLFGAWLLGDRLVEHSSPDLGPPVVVADVAVAITTTTGSDPTNSTTSTTSTVDTSVPPERTSVPDVPAVPEMPQGAESPTLYPTCPAGTDVANDDDNDGVVDVDDPDDDDPLDDDADDADDRLDDLCDE